MDNCIASYQQLLKVQEREQYDLETRIKCYEEERMEFEKERAGWKEELDQARQEIIEQNDRLTVLSEQLAGRKVCVCVCLSSPSNQRFYRQIIGYGIGMSVNGYRVA